ncbi:co-chaperone HscB [Pectobacteriaceae bacterium CE70]|uniref:Co-chaperone protein HscB n=1 Tax=Serratia sp. (strain ATCC 39006) TaxID=104623 RepID=A0A2I5TI74_SERS3|nr:MULTISPECIES: co-chaperone HscB [Enterobacterales]WJV61536.1 co-chaperone HscB [Pectobacteriaceae bacterium C52]WJV65809.1 co-chaperone HscB [Pectobacteriaceae bacterium CE70]WJY09829.1 co-chaperone HscB [Pectobacteriaceae bacterium C80]AUG99940.1 co-chaperone HscB [Serratia sp. ATCC 39006]AUH04260.1 co-chaperone HscB [Serratia sp. ATCC 39006]
MDYFTLFGLPIRYNVDGSLLVSRYQELQRQFHPDRFAASPERERMMSLQQAATINDAYQTLKHPLKRAEYMLSLHGFDLMNEQHTLQDTEFLMEQLELREELDAIEHQSDIDIALSAFSDRLNGMIHQRSEQMQRELDDESWAVAADTVRKLRFFDKLQQTVEQLEEHLLER